jgi:drug/metabolite transporter (DMT)-like permease
MFWLTIVICAYLFGALANVGDKFLLGSKRISSAPVYAFYIGVFGLGALVLAPFGLNFPEGNMLFLCLISGALFLAGITFLYFAIERAQASRVVPVVGAIIPLVSFFLAMFFSLEKLTGQQIFGVALLIFGGLLISFDLPLKLGKKKFFSGFYYAMAAGFLMAAAYLMFKYISNQQSFVTWYVWTRIGSFAGACGLLFVPRWRKMIFNSFSAVKKDRKQTVATGGIFLGNKIVGGISTLMLNYAIKLGSVTALNALVSLQYVFVLALATALSHKRKHIFQENLEFWDWMQKILAIFIIGFGIFFISR